MARTVAYGLDGTPVTDRELVDHGFHIEDPVAEEEALDVLLDALVADLSDLDDLFAQHMGDAA